MTQTMTLEQFFERLEVEAPKRQWYFVGDGMVRSGDNCLCPIEVVAGQQYEGDIDSPWSAAMKLGLRPDVTEMVIEIADTMSPYTGGPPPQDLIPWRLRLLECCGLASQEEKGTP